MALPGTEPAGLSPDGKEPLPGDLECLVGVISREPGVLEALVGRHPLLLDLDQELPDEVFALLAHILEGLVVKLPVTALHVLQRLNVTGACRRN